MYKQCSRQVLTLHFSRFPNYIEAKYVTDCKPIASFNNIYDILFKGRHSKIIIVRAALLDFHQRSLTIFKTTIPQCTSKICIYECLCSHYPNS